MPEISVIIPVYNTARFLSACLDSVLDQTFADTEIICVDDGSTDDSLQILRRYEKRDGRVKVLTQRNARQGAARNRGLEIAAGRYVMFVDSDDWLDNDALEILCRRAAADDADIVLTGTRLYDENGGSLGRDYMNFEGWAGWQNGIPAEKFFAFSPPSAVVCTKRRFCAKTGCVLPNAAFTKIIPGDAWSAFWRRGYRSCTTSTATAVIRAAPPAPKTPKCLTG